MIRVNAQIELDEREIQEDFVRASGSGGQNVNKVSTAVQLRFDVARSPSLPEPVRAAFAAHRPDPGGELAIGDAATRADWDPWSAVGARP